MKLNVIERIVTVVCLCWLVIVYIKWWLDSAEEMGKDFSFPFDQFVVWGVGPLILALALMWIRRVRKKSDGPE